MPISIDIHANEFLEEIFQEGRDTGGQEGAATVLRASLTGKFEA